MQTMSFTADSVVAGILNKLVTDTLRISQVLLKRVENTSLYIVL